MSLTSFLDDALHGMADAFAPLGAALADAAGFRSLLSQLGWSLDPAVDDAHFAAVQDIFAEERAAIAALIGADGVALVGAIPALAALFLRPRVADPAWPAPLDQAEFWNGTGANDPPFAVELLDAILFDQIVGEAPIASGLLRFVGAISEEERPAVAAGVGQPARMAYTRRRVDWGQLGRAIAQPTSIPGDVYQWDRPPATFDHTRFIDSLSGLVEGLHIGVGTAPASSGAYALYFDSVATSPASIDQLTVSPFSLRDATGALRTSGKLTLNALPIPAAGTRTGDPVGFTLFPLVTGQVDPTVQLSDTVSVSLRGEFSAIPVLAEIRPSGATLNTLGRAAATLDAELRLAASATGAPWKLIGSAGSTRLELDAAHLAIAAQGTLADPAITIELGIDSAALAVDFGDGDSFLQSVFGSGLQRIVLTSAVTWSSRFGFRFGGQAHLTVTIPVHAAIADILELDSIEVSFGTDGGERSMFTAGLSGRVSLGPVSASIDRVGLGVAFAPTRGATGSLGVVDIDCLFEPPKGVGVAIDAGPVTGGGFLTFDQPSGRYSGILQLQLLGIGVDAIGLLDTKLPDGSPGYSFLIIIAASIPPIQLGFGFILNGIGGLVGLNRTIAVDAVQAGVRQHAIDHVLFPDDPVHNATQIVADLATLFPPLFRHYVFGPMGRVGWGTPPLITAEVGVVLEFPGPRLAILGQADMNLPSSGAPLVALHLDIAGLLDVSGRRLSIDTSLHDSHVALFSIYGDAAFRLTWADQPSFALAVGGLNPNFQPPPGFPSLRRVTVALGDGDNPRIDVQGYFALTSNSLQFGALAELYASAGKLNVHGQLGFDALFVFDPFGFRFDYTTGFDLRWGDDAFAGVSVTGTLVGVSPWRATGEASISVLFWHISVSFDVSFGDDSQPVPPSVDPWPQLRDAIAEPRNWSTTLPPDAFRVASLVGAPMGTTLLEPLGGLTVRQRVLPLDHHIDKFGDAAPVGSDRYTITAVRIGGAAPTAYMVEMDYFAPAQYEALSDDEKLSIPSYEQLVAGLSLRSDVVSAGASLGTQLEYETRIIETPWDGRTAAVYAPPLAEQLSMLAAGATARSRLRTTGLASFAPDPRVAVGVSLPHEVFVVASTDNLTIDASFGAPMQRSDAVRSLSRYLGDHPEARGRLQVLSRAEAAT